MSTDIPTPNPRPEWEAMRTAMRDRADREWKHDATLANLLNSDFIEEMAAVAERVLDLPARDARIRAEVAEEIARAIEATKPSVRRFWDTADASRAYALNDAAKVARKHATRPAESVAAGSAVPAEGSGHPQPATTAAGRLREIASDPQRCREWLRGRGLGDAGPGAVLLAAAADLAEGDTNV